MVKIFRERFLLEIIVFGSGALVMIYEIIGSRILAPYMGTSTYIWTSLIGVILGSLSLGYWLGGRIADRKPDSRILSAVLFSAATLVTITILVQETFLFALALVSLRLEFKALIAALVLFAPASILFGFVSPYAIRLKMINLEDAGKTVGRLYALSTIGSILGTFAAGFFLLPFIGSVRTMYLIAGILFCLAIITVPFKLTAKKLSVFILFLLAIGLNEFVRFTLTKNYDLHDFDTRYNRVRVWTSTQPGTEKRVRVLSFDPFSTQSSMFLDSGEMASQYLKYYHLIGHFNPNFQRTLNIGGAGYSFPKDYLKKYPTKQIDVVEIDPQVTQIAKDYFRLEENENLRVFHDDGRVFLNQTTGKYDAIVVDAFGSVFSAPFQIATIESIRKLNEVLTDEGVVVVNLISAIKGENSYFLQAEYKTYAEVFPNVFLFTLGPNPDENSIQNLILVASKSNQISFESKDEDISTILKNRREKPIELTVPILTDDLAPVEYYNSFAQKSARLNQERLKDRMYSLLNKIFTKN